MHNSAQTVRVKLKCIVGSVKSRLSGRASCSCIPLRGLNVAKQPMAQCNAADETLAF